MTNTFDIVPYERVGCINFGDTRSQVLDKLGAPDKSLIRNRGQLMPRDAYYTLGIFISYSQKDGLVDLVESFEPAEPMLQGINLMNPNYKKTISILRCAGYNIEDQRKTSTCGYESYDIGIGFYILEKLETVYFFNKGYFDEYNAKNGPQK